MTTTATSLTDTFKDFLAGVASGDIMPVFEKHYHESCAMTEGTGETFKGKDTNREREKKFLAGVKEWKSLTIHASAVTDNGDGSGESFIEYSFDFINTDDQPVRYEQVARQTWKDNQIVSERFYYNAG